MTSVWIFGYGSLVSPLSFGKTLRRAVTPGVDFHEADLVGFGRRWNYGVMSRTAASVDDDGRLREWTVVALGIVASPGDTVNGVVGWVTASELKALDLRERHYERVDVTDVVTMHGASVPRRADDHCVMTYVPRSEAIQHYEAARDRGAAAIERRYYDLVDGAFGDLGRDRRERYHALTTTPDVPIVSMRWDDVPERHRITGDT